LVLLAGAPLAAQVDDEVIAGVQFNFTPPGARSLALGGAFLAIANDATAAYTNPAGLTNLTQQEISAEGRTFSYSTLFTSGGRAQCTDDGTDSGTTPCVDGIAADFGFDNRDGLVFGESSDDTSGLSFVSYVLPVNDFRFAIYRHELVNYQSAFRSEGAFLGAADDSEFAFFRLFPIDTRLELDIENFGVSIAYKFGGFSLGLSANYYQFDISSLTSRFNFVSEAPFTEPGQFFGPPLYDAGNVFVTQVQSGDDEDLGVNVGFLWELGTKFVLGGSYRDGVSFDYDYVVTCGPADPVTCNFPPRVGAPQFNVPSVWGVGIAIRPTERFTIAIDYNGIEYSALTESFVSLAEPSNVPSDFVVDDADEIHLGLEYVFANLRNPITIRVGAWEDPAHQIRYGGDAPTTSVVLWAGSNLADDETHVTGGLGFTLGENFGIDLAGDFSERVDIAALSAFFRF
jgi:hypothetical protein